MPNFISFGAAIYDPSQSDTTPSNLASLTPGGGGFTPGGRDLLKNIAGHMIANGGWTLAGAAGSDPATYTLWSNGPSGGDVIVAELSWDTNHQNIQIRMAPGLSGNVVNGSVSPYQLWPVTNGGSATVNNPYQINVLCWADKNGVSIVTKDSPARSNYKTHFAFGMIVRWSSMVPTAQGQQNKDYTAIFYTLPTRTVGNNSGISLSTPGYGMMAGSSLGSPIYASYGPSANGYSNGTVNYNDWIVLSAIMVYQNYGDASRSWVPNFLSDSGYADSDTTGNENNANYLTNIRQPNYRMPTYGTDGLFHMRRTVVWQLKNTTDTAPMTRGTLPATFVFCGVNAGNDGNPIVAGTETYTITNINLGYWPGMNPNGFAIRSA
ncbi:hypothetical protein J7643_03765 [bacterium]|nr:hypothetical protein [bacterium]